MRSPRRGWTGGSSRVPGSSVCRQRGGLRSSERETSVSVCCATSAQGAPGVRPQVPSPNSASQSGFARQHPTGCCFLWCRPQNGALAARCRPLCWEGASVPNAWAHAGGGAESAGLRPPGGAVLGGQCFPFGRRALAPSQGEQLLFLWLLMLWVADSEFHVRLQISDAEGRGAVATGRGRVAAPAGVGEAAGRCGHLWALQAGARPVVEAVHAASELVGGPRVGGKGRTAHWPRSCGWACRCQPCGVGRWPHPLSLGFQVCGGRWDGWFPER